MSSFKQFLKPYCDKKKQIQKRKGIFIIIFLFSFEASNNFVNQSINGRMETKKRC